jgi:glycosyltransferase involved in cell wall biosynthesis
MRVSVVIPTYYRSRELAKCLDGILGQEVKPMEVIVVDDTPVDEIRQLFEDFLVMARQEGVDLIYTKNHRERSTSIARNIGAKAAKGEIVLFVDSDVVLHRGYIEGLLKAYSEHPEAVGITGWIKSLSTQTFVQDIHYWFFQSLKRLFFLFHDSRDSCRFSEYPIVLTRVIVCQRFVGANMSCRRSLFDEFEFDESLKGYAYWEDALFSGSVNKKYPGRLLMTPASTCTHSFSEEGREKKVKMRIIKRRNRKYVLVKLFGARGLLMFGWQNFGLLVFKLIGRIKRASIIIDETF